MATGCPPGPRAGLLRRCVERARHHEGRAPALHHDPGDARHRPRRDAHLLGREADPGRRRRGEHRLDRQWRRGGIPVPFLLFIGIAALAWFTLKHTSFGRQVYAVGDNLEAARLSGIPTQRVIFSVYVISGLCAAVSALIVVARLAAAEATQGEGLELDAIAIVVIGGTSLFGGSGGVGGTLVGAGIVAAVNNLLNLLGVPPFSQRIAKGLIILGAVLLERRTRGREEGR